MENSYKETESKKEHPTHFQYFKPLTNVLFRFKDLIVNLHRYSIKKV